MTAALIVEGSVGLRRLLRARLLDQGIDVTMAGSVEAAREQLGQRAFPVVIVDLVLPDGSGLSVLDTLRESGSAAHVIVLSDSTGESDRLAASEHGADDYLVKPFLLRQLAARVLSVRRLADPVQDSRLDIGLVVVDLRTREAWVDGRLLDLSADEFDLLAYLAARPGHTFSGDELLRAVRGRAPGRQPTTVATLIRRLRAKVELDPSRPKILRTVRGTGYRLERPDTGRATGAAGSPPVVATLVHVQGRIVQSDEPAAALLGLETAADLLGRQIFEFATPVDMEVTRRRMSVPAPAPRARTQLIDLEHTDGTQVSVEVASEALVWKGHPAERLRFTLMPDVSARLRRLVTGVLSEVTDAVVITDLHFHLRSWNAAAERLYGWKEVEVLGRHVLDVMQWVGDEGALAATWENLEVNGRWRGESRQATRDGSVIDVLASTTLLRDHDGAPVLIVSVIRPVPVGMGAVDLQHRLDDQRIRAGLANGEFEVHYQPVVALADGAVITMEALARWNHPERGLLAPDAFIAEAERSGSIVELGGVVLEKACHQMAEWRRAGHDIDVSVNVSGRQLSEPGLVERITVALESSGLEPERLWLEITETSLVEEVDRAGEVLYRLADLGVSIAIDDFGTGWASLTYLRSFPVHALKIDRSFVAGVGSNANDTAIVRSILSLGAELGLFVVAEGIESVDQRTALQKLGCTIGQGFLYGAPVPAGSVALGPPPAGRPVAPPTSSGPHHPLARRVPARPTVVPVHRVSTAEILASDPATGDGSA